MLSGFKCSTTAKKLTTLKKSSVKGSWGSLFKSRVKNSIRFRVRGLFRHWQLIHCEFFLERSVRKKIRERATADIEDAARSKVRRNEAVGALCSKVCERRFEQTLPARICGLCHDKILLIQSFPDYTGFYFACEAQRVNHAAICGRMTIFFCISASASTARILNSAATNVTVRKPKR